MHLTFFLSIFVPPLSFILSNPFLSSSAASTLLFPQQSFFQIDPILHITRLLPPRTWQAAHPHSNVLCTDRSVFSSGWLCPRACSLHGTRCVKWTCTELSVTDLELYLICVHIHMGNSQFVSMRASYHAPPRMGTGNILTCRNEGPSQDGAHVSIHVGFYVIDRHAK